MSHKDRNRGNQNVQPSTYSASVIVDGDAKPTKSESKGRQDSATETGGFSWQLIYLLAVTVLGLLTLLGKILGLF